MKSSTPRNRIWLSPPHMGGDELGYVQEAFKTNWIAPAGPHIATFEEALAAYTGVAHCAALSSGTAAIQLALILLGVQRGDEVICSTFTFAGSCNPIVYLGAQPVFIDSETGTWNMDPSLLEEAIEDRIKKTKRKPACIILVHLYGMPARLAEIMAIAHRYEIPVIEDAAEALGSTYMGQKLGTQGILGVYSFNGNKIITTSGGGALIANRKDLIEKARFLATQARDPAPHYEHSSIGFNFRLSNICAGIGLGQLKVIDERVRRRRAIFDRYFSLLSKTPGISFSKEPDGFLSNRWLTTILIEVADHQYVREELRQVLDSENIESRPLWKPMHLQPVYRGSVAYVNGVSERLFAAGLCLPSGSNLSDSEVDLVAGFVNRFMVTIGSRG